MTSKSDPLTFRNSSCSTGIRGSADAESARNLSDMARGFIAVAKLQIAKQQPDFLQLLDGIDVRSNGSSVTVRIDESGDLVMKLQKVRLQPHQLGQ